MKYRVLFAAFLAVSLTACTDKITGEHPEDGGDIEAPKTFNKTFSASFADGDPATRTVLREDNTIAFQSGDAISVFDVCLGEDADGSTVKNVKFEMDGEPFANGSASFTGTLENEMTNYMAVYPYQESNGLEIRFMQGKPVSYTVSAVIPSSQAASSGTFDPTANVSVAKSLSTESGDKLFFKNFCSLIKFSIPEGETYSKIVFKANNGESLAGTAKVQASISGAEDTGFTFQGIMDEGSSSVTLSGEISGGNCYYIAVIPADLEGGFSIEMYDTPSHLASTKSSGKKVNLKRSSILNLGEISGDWLGSGTASDPYRIASLAQLKKLAGLFTTQSSAKQWKGKYFLQTEDIDCKGEYIRIGGLDEGEYLGKPTDVFFEGVYDGNYHKISNFKLKGQEQYYDSIQYYGLFAQARNATFRNMFLEPASIYEDPQSIKWVSNYYYIGTLIGNAGGGNGIEINNCHVSSEKELVYTPAALSTVFGGLVGYCCEQIEMYDCSSDMDLLFYNDGGIVNGGGLVGVISAPLTIFDDDAISIMDRCRNTGNIRVIDTGGSSQSVAGGLVGMTFDTGTQDLTLRVSSSVNNGDISASSDGGYSYAAGLIAFQDSDGDWSISQGNVNPYLYNCLNTGNIHAEGGDGSLSSQTGTFAGGLAGYIYDDDTHFALCANTGRVSIEGDDNIGAISASNGNCLWCYWLNAKSHTETGATPSIPCVKDGSTTNCYYYRTIGADTMNNRRTGKDGQGGEDIVLDERNTYWQQFQWIIAGVWTGSSTYDGTFRSLDIDFYTISE